MSQSESGVMDLVRNGAMGAAIVLCVGLIGAQFMGGDADDAAEVDAAERDATVERIQPVAVVNIAGEAVETSVADPAGEAVAASETPVDMAVAEAAQAELAAAAAPAVAAAIDGEAIYKAHCFACHGTGAAGAPIVGDAAVWAPRIATGQDALVASAIGGKGGMPPKGGAMNRSDEEITAVVVYMMQSSQ